MKKFFILVAALLGLTFTASAEQKYSASFLNVRTLCITNNTLVFTNLSPYTALAQETANTVNQTFTNLQGRKCIVTASAYTNFNVFNEGVDLPSSGTMVCTTNATDTAVPVFNGCGIFVRGYAASTMAGVVTLVFEPVPNGVWGCPGYNETNCISVAVETPASQNFAIYSRLDYNTSKLAGVQKLRLRRVVNADTSSTVYLHQVDLIANKY